jgi:hypothetical protein
MALVEEDEGEGECTRGCVARRARFLGGDRVGIETNVVVDPLRIRSTTTISSRPHSSASASAARSAGSTTGHIEREYSTAHAHSARAAHLLRCRGMQGAGPPRRRGLPSLVRRRGGVRGWNVDAMS